MLLCTVSRALGFAATGRWEMLCSVCAESRWFSIPVDAAFFLGEGQSYHCTRMRDWEASQCRLSGHTRLRSHPSA